MSFKLNIEKVIEYFRKSYAVKIKETDYEFQKGVKSACRKGKALFCRVFPYF